MLKSSRFTLPQEWIVVVAGSWSRDRPRSLAGSSDGSRLNRNFPARFRTGPESPGSRRDAKSSYSGATNYWASLAALAMSSATTFGFDT
jgi:hypothetical protein